MKKYFSGLVTGIALTTLVGGLVVGASAISSKMTITVDPINIMVNGKIFEPKDANGNPAPVFAYNGTTMAPLRALAEAYGLEVGYDKERNMATVAATDVPGVPSTSVFDNVVSNDWTDEDEEIYRELTENWVFTFLGETSAIGVGEADTATYLAEPKNDKATSFDWNDFEKSDKFVKIATKIVDTVNTTNLPDTIINYSGGRWISTYNGDISIWSA